MSQVSGTSANMRLLIRELVLVVAVTYIMRPFFKYYQPSVKLLKDLIWYVPPPRKELRKLSSAAKSKKQMEKNEDFTLPKSANITLDTQPINADILTRINLFEEYRLIVVLGLTAIVGFATTEVYCWILDRNTTYHSGGCYLLGIAAVYVIYVLSKIIVQMYSVDEWAVCAIAAVVCWLMSIGTLLIGESLFDFGLVEAYEDFRLRAELYLTTFDVVIKTFPSYGVFIAMLSIVCAVIGALMCYPCYRYAVCHFSSLRYYEGNALVTLLLLVSYMMPAIVLFSFIPGLQGFFFGIDEIEETRGLFELLRLGCIVFACVARLATIRIHVQSFLNEGDARLRLLLADRSASNRIHVSLIERQVAHIFNYTCIAVAQLLSPSILLLSVALLMKSRGGLGWSGHIYDDDVPTSLDSLEMGGVVVLSPMFYRSVLGFLSWWLCASSFLMCSLWVGYVKLVKGYY